jgi:peptidoglycan/xylan/chitin deacetylase (PgdA/CDA1 family)
MRDNARPRATVAVSVDLDAPEDYATFYGLPCPLEGERFLELVLPAFLDLFAAHGIRATFFAIARDAASPAGARLHRRLADAGHEVANHTLSHVTAFRTLTPAARRREIVDARARLEDAIGRPVVGFRTPAYDVDPVTLGILLEAGFVYDSSLNPTPFLVPMKWIIHALARRRKVGLGTWRHRFAPRRPHWYGLRAAPSAGGDGPAARAQPPLARRLPGPPADGTPALLELPLSLVPPVRFPFYGTITQILGPRWFRWAAARVRALGEPINYELHALELAATGRDEDLAALRKVPGYGEDGARKAAVLRATLPVLAADAECVPLVELAARLGAAVPASLCPPQEGRVA